MNNQNKRKIEENTEDSKQFGKLIFFIVLSVFVQGRHLVPGTC